MGERDPGSFLALVKRTNTHYAKAAGISSEEEKEMTSLRSDIDEETYKFMLAPLLSHLLTQLVLENEKVSFSSTLCRFFFVKLRLFSMRMPKISETRLKSEMRIEN